MTDEKDAVALRDDKGHYLPGNPGGPGRPKGLTQSERIRALLEPYREELIGAVIALARDTDPFARARGLELALLRLAPAPKAESEMVFIPGLAQATTFGGKCDAVLQAVANGGVSAEAGERVLRLIDIYRKAHETDTLERRLAALEAGKTVVTIEQEQEEGLDLI